MTSTHNTQVYVQWMPYSFVWLYLLKYVFTCSIFVDSNTKFFLSILGVFGKYFVFTKTEKFQKQCCPVLATQSRVTQVACFSRALACYFWRLVHEWRVQSRGVHRDFHGSARDSLADRPSSHEKHLEIFFTILSLSVLVARPGDLLVTHFNRKKRVFCISKTVFKTFSVFRSNFCDYSLSSPFLSQKLTQTLLKLHFYIISSQIFKKMYGFSLFHFIVHVLSLLFLFLWVFWGHYDFVKCHTHSRIYFILVIVHCLRVSVFDFIIDVCM